MQSIITLKTEKLSLRLVKATARLAAEELAKATRSEVVQVIGTKFVLYRETHSKPKEKRIQLVKPAKKKANP